MTHDLAEARGPDVACSIEVPVAWFEAGATLQIQLPRLLTCARCEGGGCDACGRRGAFEQQAAGIAREVAVVLPTQSAANCTPVKLRLPSLGARAPESVVADAEPPAAVTDAEPLTATVTSPVPEHAESLAAERADRAEPPVATPALAAPATSLALVAAGAAPPVSSLALVAVGAAPPVSSLASVPAAAVPPVSSVALVAAGAAPSAGDAAPSVAAEAPSVAAAEVPPVTGAAAPPVTGAAAPRGLPPGHLLLTIIPRAPDPGWVPPSNVQALVLASPQRSFWAPLELLLFPDRLAAALRAWWQERAPAALRARPAWFWAALAVVVTVSGFWLLTRSGSRSQ